MLNKTSPKQLSDHSLCATQRSLCDYLRNPEQDLRPSGINARRLNVYRDLVFNNIESLLSSSFPVMKNILANRWQEIVREFISDYRATTPYFTQMGNEFYIFVKQRNTQKYDPPFLAELAKYELLELELMYRKSSNEKIADIAFIEASLAISPLTEIEQFHYPVHQLSTDFKPNRAPETFTNVLMYRDNDYSVGFMQLSDFSFQLLSLISQYPGYNAQYWMQLFLTGLPKSLTDGQKKSFFDSGIAFLNQLYQKNILYATAPQNN